jgi:hypothetical protein
MMDLGTAGERIEIHAPGRNEVHASWSFLHINLTPFHPSCDVCRWPSDAH